MILTLRVLPSTQIQKDRVAPVQYLVSGCTPGSDRSQWCKSRRPDDHNDVRKASNPPLVLFSETRRKQPSKTEKMSIVTPFSVPLRIPQVVIVCPKREETALSPFLRSKRVTEGRKCPKNGTQKPDHLIRTGSYDPVGGIDTSAFRLSNYLVNLMLSPHEGTVRFAVPNRSADHAQNCPTVGG